MMPLNVANTNQVMQKSNMVGFLPSVAPKAVLQREESTHTFLDDIENAEGFSANEDSGKPSNLQPTPQQMASAQRGGESQAAQSNQPRNRISQNTTFNQWGAAGADETEEEQEAGLSGSAQRAGQAQQNQQNQGTNRSELWYSLAGQSGNLQEGEKNTKTGPSSKMGKPKFDTGRLIQLQYLANQGANLVANVVMSAAEKALAAKEFFLRNFFRLVDTEYKQYVKSDDSMYSRKNLREILSALGETINPFSAKNKKWRKDKGLEPKGFDKLSQRAAGRTLKIFDEMPEPEEQQKEPMEIVW